MELKLLQGLLSWPLKGYSNPCVQSIEQSQGMKASGCWHVCCLFAHVDVVLFGREKAWEIKGLPGLDVENKWMKTLKAGLLLGLLQ